MSTEGLELHGRVHALSGVHEVAVQMRLHDGVQELELCVVASPQNPLQQVASLWEKKIKTLRHSIMNLLKIDSCKLQTVDMKLYQLSVILIKILQL